MEYVHENMRAACMEPVNVLSSLLSGRADSGYYESTKDASTNFFRLVAPWSYVFEYVRFCYACREISATASQPSSVCTPRIHGAQRGYPGERGVRNGKQ